MKLYRNLVPGFVHAGEAQETYPSRSIEIKRLLDERFADVAEQYWNPIDGSSSLNTLRLLLIARALMIHTDSQGAGWLDYTNNQLVQYAQRTYGEFGCFLGQINSSPNLKNQLPRLVMSRAVPPGAMDSANFVDGVAHGFIDIQEPATQLVD